MILTDAGPLIALLDSGESEHDRCVKALRSLRGPMVTTWPAFTEAMYLLGAAGGWRGQQPLWRLILDERLRLVDLTPTLLQRMAWIMEKYHDRPMDLADASLVAVAEAQGFTRIFSLDRDFHVYRLAGGHALQVIP